ncbi:hypothetical protein [Thalassomonas haliotis]|uniref:Uncharacterized protein n=1 Tax=Thalassomonas haliotis TaxID=485448 RepID=A0ABY7VCP2_9GAMM|nr:hypothetical protein [Thalassomonas haliotis]WDE11323.1 hypothetical protein H3N35_24395 [Thalassomonas haliotis]
MKYLQKALYSYYLSKVNFLLKKECGINLSMSIRRSLTMYLALFLVVYAATFAAVSYAKFSDQGGQVALSEPGMSKPAKFSFSGEQDDFDGYFNPPGGLRASAPVFAAQVQAEPDYVLEIEFFASELAAAFFKNLSNPPLAPIWHQQLRDNNQTCRISGWKDGNCLYSGRITYHS